MQRPDWFLLFCMLGGGTMGLVISVTFIWIVLHV